VWIIVGKDGASSDNGVSALTSLVVRGLTVQCGGLESEVVLFFFFFFSELSFDFMQFVSMSQSNRLELFFSFLLSLFSDVVVGHYYIVVPTLGLSSF